MLGSLSPRTDKTNEWASWRTVPLMRLSEFWALMEQEFGGPYGRSLARSHAIHALGDRTASEAIEAGEPVRRVWASLCDDLEVPPERRLPAERRH
ncbi:hypothetical protein BH23ACT6_BH23ACT6_19260 [soil metagenome]